MGDSPDLAAAKLLLDEAKELGFRFTRTAPGPDAPLLGVRETVDYVDEVVLTGCSREGSCYASRRGRSSLVVAGGTPLIAEVTVGLVTQGEGSNGGAHPGHLRACVAAW